MDALVTRIRDELTALPTEERRRVLADLPDSAVRSLLYDWQLWARPKQLAPPGRWSTWLVLAGRGFGKTRTGAEWVRDVAERDPTARIALIARTRPDAKDVMVEGESGLLAVSPPWFRPRLVGRHLYWPNGARGRLFTAEEPDELRGPQHTHAWGDELAAWKYEDTWDQLQFGLRLGSNPQAIVTTTPRPTKLVKELLADPDTITTRGSTYENRGNLAPKFVRTVIKKYEGTRLGRQELEAEVLDDTPGALWKLKTIDALRVKKHPELVRIVVACDPAVTSNEDSDETGIVVAGAAWVDDELHAFVLEDCSGKFAPHEWAELLVTTLQVQKADRIVAEVNNGGDLVEANIRTVDQRVPYKAVHASRGKRTRAEPVASLYEQGRVHHVGVHRELEDQMTTWQPALERSPDRLDAMVWAITELLLETKPSNAKAVMGDDTKMPKARLAELEEDSDYEDDDDDRPGRAFG